MKLLNSESCLLPIDLALLHGHVDVADALLAHHNTIDPLSSGHPCGTNLFSKSWVLDKSVHSCPSSCGCQ